MSYLTEKPLDSQTLVKGVMRPADGACVVFEGVVRDHHQGKRVESILYEAYRPMAEKEITKIINDINAHFPQVAIALEHRLGVLIVGEASIVIACASPHRGEAFQACRMVIDRFKQTVPIWKKERGPDGEEWVGWQQ
jgi:molybdopterin synthase catalytic subunit